MTGPEASAGGNAGSAGDASAPGGNAGSAPGGAEAARDALIAEFAGKCTSTIPIANDGLCFYRAILTSLNQTSDTPASKEFAVEIGNWLEGHKDLEVSDGPVKDTIQGFYDKNVGNRDITVFYNSVGGNRQRLTLDQYIEKSQDFSGNDDLCCPKVWAEVVVAGHAAANLKTVNIIIYNDAGEVISLYHPAQGIVEKTVTLKNTNGNHFDVCNASVNNAGPGENMPELEPVNAEHAAAAAAPAPVNAAVFAPPEGSAAAAPVNAAVAPVNPAPAAVEAADENNDMPFGPNAGMVLENAPHAPKNYIIAKGGINHAKEIRDQKAEQYLIAKQEHDLALKAVSDAKDNFERISKGMAPHLRETSDEFKDLESAKTHYLETVKALEQAKKAALKIGAIDPGPPAGRPRASRHAPPPPPLPLPVARGLPLLPPHERGSAAVPPPLAAQPPLPPLPPAAKEIFDKNPQSIKRLKIEQYDTIEKYNERFIELFIEQMNFLKDIKGAASVTKDNIDQVSNTLKDAIFLKKVLEEGNGKELPKIDGISKINSKLERIETFIKAQNPAFTLQSGGAKAKAKSRAVTPIGKRLDISLKKRSKTSKKSKSKKNKTRKSKH